MSIQEIESEVKRLSAEDLAVFAAWFEEYVADAWDKRLEADAAAGKLDHLAKKADQQFEDGKCDPL